MANIFGTGNNDIITPGSISPGVTGGRPTDGNDNIDGGSGNDSVDGGDGDDFLANGKKANDGSDTLLGGNGDDTLGNSGGILDDSSNDYLNGGAGNDLMIILGVGRDWVFGSAGTDTLKANYAGASSGITISYDSVTGGGSITGTGVLTTFSGIELLNISGSDYADSMVGGTGNDLLEGFEGNDTLVGGAGDDTLGSDVFSFGISEGGNDYLNGGIGNDLLLILGAGRDRAIGSIGNDTLIADYFDAGSGVAITHNSIAGSGSIAGTGALTTFSGVEAFNISGSNNYADTLVGGGSNDTLYGGLGGNDFLFGGAGDDILIGNDGKYSYLSGGIGNDLFDINGDGRDWTFGSTGTDTLKANYARTSSGITMTYDSITGSGSISGTDVLTTFSGIEAFNIYGSDYADTLVGSVGNDTLDGGGVFGDRDGSNYLNGGAGNDLLFIRGDGRDRAIGGVGADTLSATYFDVEARSGIVMTYDSITGGGSISGTGILTTFSGVEAFNIVGTQYSDSLVGGIGNDSLSGESEYDTLFSAVNDTLIGNAGNDALGGIDNFGNIIGNGNDYLNGGTGNDLLIIYGDGQDRALGSTGFDTLGADYSDASSGIDMTYNSISGSGSISGGGVLTTFSGIEVFAIRGSNFSDTLVGRVGDDSLDGSDGNDFLLGGAGNDWLIGGSDNDYLSGTNSQAVGVGEIDTLTGSEGSDRFVLATVNTALYDDGNNASKGLNDYAIIADFDASVDSILLKDGLSYVLGASPVRFDGTGIFVDNDGIAGLSDGDEFVGLLKNVTLTPGAITASTDGFTFV